MELEVPRPVPAHVASRKLRALFGMSRRPPGVPLRQLGFGRVEFYNDRGATLVTMHLAAAGTGMAGVNPRADNFAALQFRPGEREPD